MILCCGEALIDMLPRTTPDGDDAFLPAPGGAVFNTAIALGRLQVPTGFWYGLSDDFFGKQLRECLDASAVDWSLAPVLPRPTTLAFVRLTDGQAEYAFYDENTAGRMVFPDDLPTLDRSVEALFFGGISLVAEPVGSTLEILMQRAGDNRVVMLDPNIRSGFISDERAYRNRLNTMAARADILKVSDEDLTWWLGDGTPEDHATQLLERGAGLVLVTLGARGALAVAEQAHARVSPESVDVVDTVGAGDTFNAGVLESLWRHKRLTPDGVRSLTGSGLEELLSRANRAAAVTIGRAGANPPWRSELDHTG